MGLALEHIDNQTHALCVTAILQNWRALEFVKNQTEELCLIAVTRNGWVLKWVTILYRAGELINVIKTIKQYNIHSYC